MYFFIGLQIPYRYPNVVVRVLIAHNKELDPISPGHGVDGIGGLSRGSWPK